MKYKPVGNEWAELERNHRVGQHTLIQGPTGCGKSLLVNEFLNALDVPFERVNPGEPKEARDLLGRYMIGPNGTERVEYQLLRAVKNGSPIFFDEIGLLPPSILSSFNTLADGQRCVTVFNETFVAKPGFWIVGTYNPPARNLSQALRERFRHIKINYLPREMEIQLLVDSVHIHADDAAFLVDVANATRNMPNAIEHGVSTRVLLEFAAKDLLEGASHEDVIKNVMIPAVTDVPETERAILEAIQALGLLNVDLGAMQSDATEADNDLDEHTFPESEIDSESEEVR